MKIIVTGSRNMPFFQSWRVAHTLWNLFQVAGTLNNEVFKVVHGGCPMPEDPKAVSVDEMAHIWVAQLLQESHSGSEGPRIEEKIYPADWNQYGKAAGPIRNRQMAVDGADLCLAFLYEPDGTLSRGTRDMMGWAVTMEIPVWSVTIH